MSRDDFMGGLFDVNHDGITDSSEMYLAFRVWEEVTGNQEDDALPEDDPDDGVLYDDEDGEEVEEEDPEDDDPWSILRS